MGSSFSVRSLRSIGSSLARPTYASSSRLPHSLTRKPRCPSHLRVAHAAVHATGSPLPSHSPARSIFASSVEAARSIPQFLQTASTPEISSSGPACLDAGRKIHSWSMPSLHSYAI